ncbi:biopolymer transporter ExbB [Desulforhopalus sp. 52FAK]
MRALQIKARDALHDLQEKAATEEKMAREDSALSRKRISKDRTTLLQALKTLETEVGQLDKSVQNLQSKEKQLQEDEKQLTAKLAETDSMIRELVGVIRINAKDIKTYIAGNLQSALTKRNIDFLQAIGEQEKFPGIDDINTMNAALWQHLHDGSSVRMTRGPIIDRNGNTIEADILALGNFTAAYRLEEEVGFLNYSSAGNKLFALSRLPSGYLQKHLREYMQGQSDAVPIDVSRGGALSQLSHSVSLWQQIEKGGPLVWPILMILALGFIIVVERILFLLSARIDGDDLTRRLETLAAEQNWQACKEECRNRVGKPLARVAAAGLAAYQQQREVTENALQEAILREVPPMERFLSTLGMLATIAPLLGLLGTVTGMIDTFQVITRHGTGDARMMSGGISVALVTTMLGLGVAIPIMLAHTLISRTVDNRIAQMEEKAAAVLSIVDKHNHAID